jgi:hypothetical protein
MSGEDLKAELEYRRGSDLMASMFLPLNFSTINLRAVNPPEIQKGKIKGAGSNGLRLAAERVVANDDDRSRQTPSAVPRWAPGLRRSYPVGAGHRWRGTLWGHEHCKATPTACAG